MVTGAQCDLFRGGSFFPFGIRGKFCCFRLAQLLFQCVECFQFRADFRQFFFVLIHGRDHNRVIGIGVIGCAAEGTAFTLSEPGPFLCQVRDRPDGTDVPHEDVLCIHQRLPGFLLRDSALNISHCVCRSLAFFCRNGQRRFCGGQCFFRGGDFLLCQIPIPVQGDRHGTAFHKMPQSLRPFRRLFRQSGIGGVIPAILFADPVFFFQFFLFCRRACDPFFRRDLQRLFLFNIFRQTLQLFFCLVDRCVQQPDCADFLHETVMLLLLCFQFFEGGLCRFFRLFRLLLQSGKRAFQQFQFRKSPGICLAQFVQRVVKVPGRFGLSALHQTEGIRLECFHLLLERGACGKIFFSGISKIFQIFSDLELSGKEESLFLQGVPGAFQFCPVFLLDRFLFRGEQNDPVACGVELFQFCVGGVEKEFDGPGDPGIDLRAGDLLQNGCFAVAGAEEGIEFSLGEQHGASEAFPVQPGDLLHQFADCTGFIGDLDPVPDEPVCVKIVDLSGAFPAGDGAVREGRHVVRPA